MSSEYIKSLNAKILLTPDENRLPKLSIDEQTDHLIIAHGITFNIKGIDAAKKFLSENNYYHKLKAYASNYSKYNDNKNPLYGKYCDLDFEYLVELSVLDMYLRRYIIEMSLNIEHFLKVRLINDITNNEAEDAYNIVNKYLAEISEQKRKEIDAKINNYYCNRYNSHGLKDLPAWELVEVLSFGDFIQFYELYYSYYPSKDNMKNNLKPVQWLRNAAAHNNCIINDLSVPKKSFFAINKKVNTFVSGIDGISENSRTKKLRNKSMHDFVVMLYVFNKVVTSEKQREYFMTELKEFVDNRMVRHKDYFIKNALLQSNYIFLKKVVDYCVTNVVY